MLRNVLRNFTVIHLQVVLGLFALYGYLSTDVIILAVLTTLSFAGALCGTFIRIVDEIRLAKSK